MVWVFGGQGSIESMRSEKCDDDDEKGMRWSRENGWQQEKRWRQEEDDDKGKGGEEKDFFLVLSYGPVKSTHFLHNVWNFARLLSEMSSRLYRDIQPKIINVLYPFMDGRRRLDNIYIDLLSITAAWKSSSSTRRSRGSLLPSCAYIVFVSFSRNLEVVVGRW